jgi:hypothetical protein
VWHTAERGTRLSVARGPGGGVEAECSTRQHADLEQLLELQRLPWRVEGDEGDVDGVRGVGMVSGGLMAASWHALGTSRPDKSPTSGARPDTCPASGAWSAGTRLRRSAEVCGGDAVCQAIPGVP